MIVSTKGRNALKLMMCLAQVDDQAYTPLKVISAQQNISLKYLENITSMLSKKKFVEAASGKGGGVSPVPSARSNTAWEKFCGRWKNPSNR